MTNPVDRADGQGALIGTNWMGELKCDALKVWRDLLCLVEESSNGRHVTVEFLTLRLIAAGIGPAIEQMRESPFRWVIVLEPNSDDTKFVQLVVTREGTLWSECVSNEFLKGEHRLSEAQCEKLPLLGWNWPSPPHNPNWYFHDQLLNTGSAVRGLFIKTLREVFTVEDHDLIQVLVRRLDEPEPEPDRR